MSKNRRIEKFASAFLALTMALSSGVKNSEASKVDDDNTTDPLSSKKLPDQEEAVTQTGPSTESAQQTGGIATAEFPEVSLSSSSLELYQQLWQEKYPDLSLTDELQQKGVVELPFALNTELPSNIQENEISQSILKLKAALIDLVATNAPELGLPVESIFQLRLVLQIDESGGYQLIAAAETLIEFSERNAGSVLFRAPGNETWRYIEKTEEDDGVGFLVADEQTAAEATQYMVVMPPPYNESGYLEFQPNQLFLGGWRNSPSGDRVIVNSVLLGESALGLEASRRQWAEASGVAFDPQTEIITATPPAAGRAPGHALEVAPPEVTEDWLLAENFAEVQLAQPLIDVLNARDEAAKERPLTEYDFKAVQLGQLPIVIDWGLDGEGMKRKEMLFNYSEGRIDEYMVLDHRLIHEYLAQQLPKVVELIPRETVIVITSKGETKAIDTSNLPATPQIIVEYCDLSDIENVPGLSARALLLDRRQYTLRVYDEENNVMKIMVAQAYEEEMEDPSSIGISVSVIQAIIAAFNNKPYEIYHGPLREVASISDKPLVPLVGNPEYGVQFLMPTIEPELLKQWGYSLVE